MKKFFLITFIFFLVFSTAIIKNSTKRIEDDIFAINENLRGLKKDFTNLILKKSEIFISLLFLTLLYGGIL